MPAAGGHSLKDLVELKRCPAGGAGLAAVPQAVIMLQ